MRGTWTGAASGCGASSADSSKLMERRQDLFFVNLEHARVLAHEIAGEHAAGQTIEPVQFNRFQ